MLPGEKRASEFEAGKGASPSDLALRIAGAGTEYLLGVLENPRFGEDHLEAILSNLSLTTAAIQRIASRKKWLGRYEIQRAILFHRNTPRSLQMNLVHFLRWRDLVRASEASQLHPPVRRAAERVLQKRIVGMALGEKIALARIVGAGAIGALCADPHPEVISALLANARMTEEQVVAVSSEERSPAAVLSTVAAHPRWKSLLSVRRALARNPGTPARSSLRLLDSLPCEDLREIVAAQRAPRLVRATARQILRARADSIDSRETVT